MCVTNSDISQLLKSCNQQPDISHVIINVPFSLVEVTGNGKVEVFFEKAQVKDNWNYLGTSLKFNDAFIKSKCGGKSEL